jgi:RNA polymerase sigma factor (sigma-70 family)
MGDIPNWSRGADPRPPPKVVPIDSGGHRERTLAKRDALVESHTYLVPPIARRLHSSLPPSFDLDDLIATGHLGLLHAATQYRPRAHGGAMLDSVRRRNYDENTRPSLEEAIEPSIQNVIEISIDERRLRKKVAEAIKFLPQRQQAVLARYYFGPNPSLAAVGAALGLKECRVVRELADAIAQLRKRLGAA